MRIPEIPEHDEVEGDLHGSNADPRDFNSVQRRGLNACLWCCEGELIRLIILEQRKVAEPKVSSVCCEHSCQAMWVTCSPESR